MQIGVSNKNVQGWSYPRKNMDDFIWLSSNKLDLFEKNVMQLLTIFYDFS
jgi:hypothetical protein